MNCPLGRMRFTDTLPLTERLKSIYPPAEMNKQTSAQVVNHVLGSGGYHSIASCVCVPSRSCRPVVDRRLTAKASIQTE